MYFPHLKQFSDHFNGCMCVSYVMHITATKKKRKRKESAPQRSRRRPTRGCFKRTYRAATYSWASMTDAPIQNHQLGYVIVALTVGFSACASAEQ